MAYKKYSKKVTRRKDYQKSWYNKNYKVNPYKLAMKAYKATRYLKGLVNSEMFHLYGDGSSPVSVTTTPQYFNLTTIPIGDGPSNRTGNSVLLKRIYIKGRVMKHASSTYTSFRMLMFQDRQQIADTDANGIFDTTSVSSPYLAPINVREFPGRFNILFSKTFTLDSTNPQQSFNILRSVQSHVKYNGPNASDIAKGCYYLCVVSNEATNAPTIAYSFDTSYHDN